MSTYPVKKSKDKNHMLQLHQYKDNRAEDKGWGMVSAEGQGWREIGWRVSLSLMNSSNYLIFS